MELIDLCADHSDVDEKINVNVHNCLSHCCTIYLCGLDDKYRWSIEERSTPHMNDKLGITILTTLCSVIVEFHSDDSDESSGFKINWEAVWGRLGQLWVYEVVLKFFQSNIYVVNVKNVANFVKCVLSKGGHFLKSKFCTRFVSFFKHRNTSVWWQ